MPCCSTCSSRTATASRLPRRSAAQSGPAVVLISSREADEYGRRIEACGARGFIPKSRLSAAAFTALIE